MALPKTFFERLTRISGLRTTADGRERRAGGMRIEMRSKGSVGTLNGPIVTSVTPVRIREMSSTGASFMCSAPVTIGREILIRVDSNDGSSYWLLARCRRLQRVDGSMNVVGIQFLKLLFPGQLISIRTNISTLLWQDVEKDANPEDPFLNIAA